MAKSKPMTQKKMITRIAIALAVVIHGTTILYMGGGVLPLQLPYPAELGGDAFSWLFTMFFVVRAIHRPWREARIAAGVFFGLGAIIYSVAEPFLSVILLILLAHIVATFFWARSINRRVKKEEKKKKKREKKRQAAEQHAQEPVEQPVQESVEEHAQAPIEEHTEEEQ